MAESEIKEGGKGMSTLRGFVFPGFQGETGKSTW